MAHFRLENDDVKKRTLVSCGTKWKAFKTKLRVKFMLKQWQEERNDPDEAAELHLILDIRGSNYYLDRAPSNKNRIKTLPPELIDVSKNLVKATRELVQGSNESKAGVDPLILVLGSEHEGHTRGSGVMLDLRAELWNKKQAEQNLFSPRQDDVPSSVQMRSNLSSTTIMVRNEKQTQQNESFSPRQDDIPSLVQRRSNLSSTKSIVRKEQQAREKVVCATVTVYPIEDGILHFKKLLKGHMKVSVIKVVEIHKSMELPVPDDEIPNLESVVKGFIQWPIAAIARFTGLSKTPVSGVLTKRVMPQHENAPSTKKGKGNETPKEPNKQDKALEETTKHQKTMQKIDEVKEWAEKEKAAHRKKLQDLEDDILLNRPQSVIDVYNRWINRGDYAEPYAIRVNKEVFRQADESYFAINATDIIELLTNQELECGILTLFEMSLYHLKGHSSQNKVGFLNPGMITADLCFYEKWETIDYITQSLTGYEFYLAPYLQGYHGVMRKQYGASSRMDTAYLPSNNSAFSTSYAVLIYIYTAYYLHISLYYVSVLYTKYSPKNSIRHMALDAVVVGLLHEVLQLPRQST
ncbi:hypothetical protein Tco_0764902 [Tanacetum coccineum]